MQLERDTDTPGLTEEQLEFVHQSLLEAVAMCCNFDGKQRHVALLVLTRDSVDEEGHPLVTTDLISTMNAEDTQHALRDFLHRKTQ